MNEKRIRVLFTSKEPSPYRVDFFNELGKLCDLTVVFERKVSIERDESWYKYKFKYFKEVFLSGIKINKYLKKELFDIFIVGGYSTPTGIYTIHILKRRGLPFILNTDGGLIKEDNLIKYKIKKYLISSANYWLSTGKETSKYLKYYGANDERIFMYPFTSLYKKDRLWNPVKNQEKDHIKNKLKISEDKIILTVGRFIYSKGIDVLLKACKNLPNEYGIYIIGGEPTEEYLELKNKLNLENVHFVGFKTKDKLKDYYMASDIFVLPTREDVWGLVINEAMAYGLPIITTDRCVAGLELIEDYKNGFIVSSDDEKSLHTSIINLMENDELMDSISKNNIDRIKRYTIENMALEHMNIFNEIL